MAQPLFLLGWFFFEASKPAQIHPSLDVSGVTSAQVQFAWYPGRVQMV